MVDTGVYAALWATVFALRRILRCRMPYLTRRMIAVACAILPLLGIVATVAVAWLCAVMVDEGYAADDELDGSGVTIRGDGMEWDVFRDAEPGAIRCVSVCGPTSWRRAAVGTADRLVPAWTDYLEPAWDTTIMRTLDARGWPMLALWGGFESTAGHVDGGFVEELGEVRHAIVLPRYFEGALRTEMTRVLPLAPLWPGFAVDALFYSTVFALLLLMLRGPGVIIATVRHASGRCPACGYPRGESPICTECGAPIVAVGSHRRV
jgi:hypothetical protein